MRYLLMATMMALFLAASYADGKKDGVPSSWLRKWTAPPAEDRPLQIIHGIEPSGKGLAGMAQIVPAAKPDAVLETSMRYYRDLGLGGVVCNVSFDNYLRSEPAWHALVDAVKACDKLGMVVWIYDEQGYPSGAAGGLVLEGNPEYEAQELAYDASRADPFIVRPSYEYTHAANNYYAARRYVNLLDDRAIRKFVALTHQAYARRLSSAMGTTVCAFFTDEPSLLAVNLGQIPESARKNVPLRDPLDPKVRPLPAVPWVHDLPELYSKRYGEDLMTVRKSLFTGDAPTDKQVRLRFWSLIADLVADRYFGEIERWCKEHRVASSGHILWEEATTHHPALYGNALKALTRMDIPGLDELSSTPSVVLDGHWMTATLPASAAMINGGRRVFTEVSDFSEKMANAGPASLPMMEATAAWQAALGVTEFTLYYGINDRSPDEYRAYCDYVGRLNAILKRARLDPDVLLYYPIRDLMAEYRPVAEPLSLQSQSERMRTIVESFHRLGGQLTRGQIPFCLIDDDNLGDAVIRHGRVTIHQHSFRAIVLPRGVELSEKTKRELARFESAGVLVVRDAEPERLTAESLTRILQPAYRLEPASQNIVMGRFLRDKRTVLALVNVGGTRWSGRVTVDKGGAWTLLDPATGSIRSIGADGGRIPITLEPLQAVLAASP